MVGGIRYKQLAAARSPAPAPLPAADAPATGAAHDPAAHSAGPGAAEERTASRKWTWCCYVLSTNPHEKIKINNASISQYFLTSSTVKEV